MFTSAYYSSSEDKVVVSKVKDGDWEVSGVCIVSTCTCICLICGGGGDMMSSSAEAQGLYMELYIVLLMGGLLHWCTLCTIIRFLEHCYKCDSTTEM